MSPTRQDKAFCFRITPQEKEAFDAFMAKYQPGCGAGDIARIGLQMVLRQHGFEFPDILLRGMTTEFPLKRKDGAEPLPKPKKR